MNLESLGKGGNDGDSSRRTIKETKSDKRF